MKLKNGSKVKKNSRIIAGGAHSMAATLKRLSISIFRVAATASTVPRCRQAPYTSLMFPSADRVFPRCSQIKSKKMWCKMQHMAKISGAK